MVAVLVAAATVAALVVLWRWIDGLALADADKRATAQLDALKLAASIVVGGGGLFALYLAVRRQRTQEMELDARHAELAQRDRVQAHVEQVADTNRLHAERVADDARVHAEAQRITELYAKSAEQLGSEKAPVRLAGLYALERLAQDNPHQRQTVVNVLCAYLRMPYTLPGDPPAEDADEQTRARYAERVQEREVRLTAQRILAAHLRIPRGYSTPKIETFWPHIDLDLTGATLVNFDLSECELHDASFVGALFVGEAKFTNAEFVKSVEFNGAAFFGNAGFDGAKFGGYARFGQVRFGGIAAFGGAQFGASAWFDGATFVGCSQFERAKFTSTAGFDDVVFVETAGFRDVAFNEDAHFYKAVFVGSVADDGFLWFHGTAWFNGAKFAGDVVFDEAVIGHKMPDPSYWPDGWRPTDEHGPIEGRKGTWHRLVAVSSDTADEDGDEPTSTS
ncbi:pentapeptide repeat-containing protein [Saccharothrix texasensis]|uniref:Pentapeptide repeat protein n=1 Tax=Saccharothrix texasensis TaxID=103734 RepID=A0A3N1H4F7_9PSEU|nr:pentapeptide repeat-containing protein [Saccharothrix texasensis]ROP37423.1 pentapeptide repeat protein [Saccharothrix texasensis]